MKKVLVIVLIIIAGFVIWKREPWVKTYATESECKNNTGNFCQVWQCDLVQTTFWLDCPHGSKFWKPMIMSTQN